MDALNIAEAEYANRWEQYIYQDARPVGYVPLTSLYAMLHDLSVTEGAEMYRNLI